MDDEWLNKFYGYVSKLAHAKYIHQHFHDSRNRDPVEDKIRLDTDSRNSIAYLKAMIDMINEVRHEGNLESI